MGGVRLCTLEESGLASKLFCGGASFASWAFTRLRRACDIRRRFRNSPILGVGASAGGCGGGQPLRRQRTYFRRLRLSTRLKRLRKRLRMVRALRVRHCVNWCDPFRNAGLVYKRTAEVDCFSSVFLRSSRYASLSFDDLSSRLPQRSRAGGSTSRWWHGSRAYRDRSSAARR